MSRATGEQVEQTHMQAAEVRTRFIHGSGIEDCMASAAQHLLITEESRRMATVLRQSLHSATLSE
jgi:hypothetical protein